MKILGSYTFSGKDALAKARECCDTLRAEGKPVVLLKDHGLREEYLVGDGETYVVKYRDPALGRARVER